MTAPRSAVTTTLLAAAAGVVDLWAVVSLGGAFAGVVTGNLVIAAGRLAGGALDEVVPAAVAVGGFVVGGLLAGAAGRTRAGGPGVVLAAEAVLLAALAVVWGVTSPLASPSSLLVLVGAAVAMGAQSVVAVAFGESTTYMTGTLTGVLRGVTTGGTPRRLAGLRVVAALVVGAGGAGLLLVVAPRVVPAVATVLVVAAALVHAWPARQARAGAGAA